MIHHVNNSVFNKYINLTMKGKRRRFKELKQWQRQGVIVNSMLLTGNLATVKIVKEFESNPTIR